MGNIVQGNCFQGEQSAVGGLSVISSNARSITIPEAVGYENIVLICDDFSDGEIESMFITEDGRKSRFSSPGEIKFYTTTSGFSWNKSTGVLSLMGNNSKPQKLEWVAYN